jgi:hypothetical protein
MGDFERTFGRVSDEVVDVRREYDDECLPSPIPVMPIGMSAIERQLFCDLRAAADNMADLLGCRRPDFLSDWVIFTVVARMPITDDEMDEIFEVRISGCTSDFLSLVKDAVAKRDAAEAALQARQKANEEKIRAREQAAKSAEFAIRLNEYVASGISPPHGKLVTSNEKK